MLRSAAAGPTAASAGPSGEKAHWSFAPLGNPSPPAVGDPAWLRTPVDAFILAKLEANGLSPASPADKRTLIRRLTFDLIGLPPTPTEIEVFLADDSPSAYDGLVERLLSSKHYGERWGRHWLDLVRFAETAGHEFDYDILGAYQYRDYVIRAFNADVPYDQFVREHLAGDLLETPRFHPVQGFNESIIGTAFVHLGEGTHSPVDIRGDEADRVDNQIDVISRAFLGLSVSCARCHDHKFDAITMRDYYGLAGYLQSSRLQHTSIDPPERIKAKADALAAMKAELRPIAIARVGDAVQSVPIARYLLAAREALRPQPGAEGEEGNSKRVAAIAETWNLNAATLDRWVKAVQGERVNRPEHPLYVWSRLGGHKNAPVDSSFMARRMEVERELTERAERARADAETAERFEDFTDGHYHDWFVSGEAFEATPSRAGDIVLGTEPSRPIHRLVAGGLAHSGMVADRLQGVLRSQTFTIRSKNIFYRMAGRRGCVNLIVDGFEKIKNPIYGGLAIKLNGKTPLGWYRQDVSKWVGHRAYVEISDGSTADYTAGAQTRYRDGSGYVAVDAIRFQDESRAPVDAPSDLALTLAGRTDLDSVDGLADAYEETIRTFADRWRKAGGALPHDDRDGVVLLNWMLSAGLLDDALSEAEGKAPEDDALAHRLARYGELSAAIPEPTLVPTLGDGNGQDQPVLDRGSHKSPGELAPRQLLKALGGSVQPAAPVSGSGRLVLVERMIDRGAPLLARVLVNRVWKHHFGQGIVRTPDDFGVMGQAATHPALLDYLAGQFVANGFSIKAMHRLMVRSNTYKMQSRPDPQAERADPDNKLWHRMPVRRLEAEAIRDAMLAVSGRLDRTMYGPGVMPHLTPFMIGRGRPRKSGPLDGDGRRSLYITVRRNFLTPMLVAFDFPVPFAPTGQRNVSNVPAQALTLMNNAFVIEQANTWAERVVREPNRGDTERIRAMYITAFGRPPEAAEVQASLAFLYDQQSEPSGHPPDLRAWSDFGHVLMNLKEFIFVR